MSSRRGDAIYFLLLLAVSVTGYYAANRPSDQSEEGVVLVLPDFSPPAIVLEVPFDFPYAIVKFESRVAPTLEFSGDMESVLGEVRSALLESSTLVEVRSMDQLVTAIE
jgi:hypothetical protein